jgi:hypothetical protein
LPDYIGKEVSDRLLSTTPIQRTNPADPFGDSFAYDHIIEGDDLSIGGEGMKEFYDKLLPKRAEKLLKPFGGRVERGVVLGDTANAPNQYSIDYDEHFYNTEGGLRPVQVRQYPDPNNVDESDPILSFLPGVSSAEAGRIVEKMIPVPQHDQWMVNLTPEMRKLILEKGFPALAMLMALQGQDKNNLPELEF